ncbi:MAG: cytochrome c biogenesis protein ResB [Puniceicoccaceae bacterium]
MLRGLLQIFASLRLTVVLLGFSMALVFFGTLDQVNFGIHETQKRYFESLLVVWNPLPPHSDSPFARIGLPLPGGYLLGPLLLVNLLVAQTYRFRWSWKKSGILLIHGGLVLLILSEFITDMTAEERQMWIDEGGTRNWAENYLENEIVLIDHTDPSLQTVYAIDADSLRAGDAIDDPRLPVRIEVEQYFPNAIVRRTTPSENLPPQASEGAAVEVGLFAVRRPETFKENDVNSDTAIVRLFDGGRDLGSWMVSNLFDEQFPPQTFTADGRTYEIALRFKRTYYPFSLTLLDFNHERYPGTEIPKDFSSRVVVTHPEAGVERETLIYMNHPLRYEGHTFYQASFANQDTSSMLQVVRNPGWTLPYTSVTLVGLGLVVQFGIGLVRSRRRGVRSSGGEAMA